MPSPALATTGQRTNPNGTGKRAPEAVRAAKQAITG